MAKDLEEDNETKNEIYMLSRSFMYDWPSYTGDIQKFFNNPVSNSWSTGSLNWDTLENEEEFIIQLAAPGSSKENFSIDLQGEIIQISHDVERETNITKSFVKSFHVPDRFDLSNVKASYENGVLLIRLQPKEKEKPKKIEVT